MITTRVGTHSEMGTGLALPICKDIMLAHGGDLEVESVPGGGSTYFVRLPEVRPLVLIVDDDEVVRYALRQQLLEEQFAVDEATNGETAIKKVGEIKPHLMLLDIFLPKIDGFAVLERLKKNPATQGIPVIVTTSDNRIETRRRALNLGAADFLAKPVKVEELVPRVLKSIA